MVEYIKAGATQLPVRVSYKALKQISTLSSESEGQYDRLERLLFFSLKEGHRVSGLPFTMDLESIIDLIDLHPEILGQFNTIMAEQMGELTAKMTGGAAVMDGLNLSDSGLETSEQESTT